MNTIKKDTQYYKFCLYGFLKNLRFFDAFFILFLIDRDLSFTEIGLLYAIREVFINVFEIPSGIIADTYGRKNALMGSFLAFIISFCVFYVSYDFWSFLMAFLLYGIGDAFRSGTHKGMIMDYLKWNDWQDQKINYYGHTRSWSQKGSAVSSLIAGFIIFSGGAYESIFLYSIIPYVLNFFLIASYPKQLNRSLVSSSSKSKFYLSTTLKSFLSIIQKPQVLKILNTSAIHTAYLRAIKDYIQLLMVNIALLSPIMLGLEQEKKIGIFIGVIYFLIYLMTSKASKLSSKVASKSKLNISNISLLIGLAFGLVSGLFYSYGLWVISLMAFVGIYIVENIRKPILTGLIADQVPNDILTSVISAQSLWRTFLTAILALMFGLVADAYGIGASLMMVSGFLIFFTVVLNVIIARKAKVKI